FRVTASDGFNTAQDESNATIAVATHAPFASIDRPADGTLFYGNQSISLEGGAYDVEDGPLGQVAFTWSSSLTGPLGTGRSLTVPASALAEGAHTITLTAHDGDGQTALASVVVQLARNRPVLPPTLLADPSILHLQAEAGGVETQSEVLAIRNAGE